jgi:hypothetical protein
MSKSDKELTAEKSFLSYKRQLINKLGSKALYDDEINKVGKLMFKGKWNGANTHDKVKFKTGYQVVNTGSSKGSGIHWVGIYITPKVMYVYDSYARNTNSILKKLEARAIKNKKTIIESDRNDAEQKGFTSEVCGHLSLSWLLVIKNRGISPALLI